MFEAGFMKPDEMTSHTAVEGKIQHIQKEERRICRMKHVVQQGDDDFPEGVWVYIQSVTKPRTQTLYLRV